MGAIAGKVEVQRERLRARSETVDACLALTDGIRLRQAYGETGFMGPMGLAALRAFPLVRVHR